jgi:acyl carrier protein
VNRTDTENPTTVETIREILIQHGRLSTDQFDDDASLYTIGLTSLATVGVMLALEERFNVEFPESMLSRATFTSVDSIAEAILQLTR